MKTLKNWFKDKLKPNPSDHAKELLISLMFNSDTEYQINTFECLKSMFETELTKKESVASLECRTINSYLPKRYSNSEIIEMKVKDPIFEQPIKK